VKDKLRAAIPGVIGLLLLAVALLVLRRELQATSYTEITS